METYLVHHGILGQKWGVRRFQNADGTLTAAGRKRYGSEGTSDISDKKGLQRRLNDLDEAIAYNKRANKDLQKENIKKTASTKGYRQGSRKVARVASKVNANNEKIAANNKNIELGRDEINKLIEKAQIMGLDVSSKDTIRYALKGEDYLKSAAKAGVLAGSIAALSTVAGAPAAVTSVAGATGSASIGKDIAEKAYKGKSYKVKETTNTKSSSSKEEKDRWDRQASELATVKQKASSYDKNTSWKDWNESKSNKLWDEYYKKSFDYRHPTKK